MDTLVRDPFRDVMPSFFGMTLGEMMRAKHPDAWGRFERGELAEDEFLASFFADRRSFDHRGFRQAIRGAYAWLPGMQGLLGRLLAQGCTMHVLSNYPVWYHWIEERLELSRYVRWSFVSCQLGLRKPDRGIFLHAARTLDVEPAQCLFIDDRATNCEAARAIGMSALHFQGDAETLERELSVLLRAQQP